MESGSGSEKRKGKAEVESGSGREKREWKAEAEGKSGSGKRKRKGKAEVVSLKNKTTNNKRQTTNLPIEVLRYKLNFLRKNFPLQLQI